MFYLYIFYLVQPTIQFNAAEPVRVQVPGKNAEDIITLELEADVIPPTPVTSTETAKSAAPTCKGKSVRGRGVKRTYSSTNTAPDYAESAAQNDSVSDQYYPAYLFQTPPSQFTMDVLCKHALISKIERNKAETTFYQMATGILGPMKQALISLGNETRSSTPTAASDHEYHSQNVNQ